ncbi:hypothetical protein [Flavobacterium succinicans]|uniref:Uncharacterized protein n=1 Tax=Flavobacterium succinicans TaxID=29536 RepID=A0A199XS75_9FLAO|nr:hypothetical protein [Flavobacterium succinicans]OAZ04495.1 hypothetical protein FLB_11090 [Flavobacterium succinicans]
MANFEFNYLLILPLLGGYVFLTFFNFTKYQHGRIETQRLIFHSIIAGLMLLIFTLYFDNYILKKHLLNFREFLGKLALVNIAGLNFYLLAFFLSPVLAVILNILIPNNMMMRLVIKIWGDEYEKVYLKSLREKDRTKKLILISLDNNKVYVGYLKRVTKPLLSQQIDLIPVVSGYRNDVTKKITFTTPYMKTLISLIEKDNGFSIIDEEMKIVLPKDKIISVSRFYPKVYKEFQEQILQIENR